MPNRHATEFEIRQFLKGYMSGALWDSSDGSSPPFDSMGFLYDESDFSEEAKQEMLDDCREFLRSPQVFDIICDKPMRRNGFYFWIVRNRPPEEGWHEECPYEKSKILAKAAQKFDRCTIFVGQDCKLHIKGNRFQITIPN